MREYGFCAYCGFLTAGRDSDGDRACPEGEGCAVFRQPARRRAGVTTPGLWTPERKAKLIDQYQRGVPVAEIARDLQLKTQSIWNAVTYMKLKRGARADAT